MSTPSPYFSPTSQTGGSTPTLQTKSVTIDSYGTTSIQSDAGYDGLQQVNLTVQVGMKPVGGRIFYIDSNSTATYKFYDSNMDEISSVAVGDTPAFYEVVDEGNGKEKYYVYYDSCYTTVNWTYYGTNNYVYENTGVTATAIGTGKINTSTMMTFNDGAYVNNKAYPTGDAVMLWKVIKNMNDNIIGGCHDWFVPSKDEVGQLRTYMINNSGTVTNYFDNSVVWSSSEKNSGNAFFGASSGIDYVSKSFSYTCIGVRSF